MRSSTDSERVELLERGTGEVGVQRHRATGEAAGLEDAHQQACVGSPSVACRRVRSRRVPGSAPALAGPTTTSPDGEIETMLPPPAPTLEISVASALMTRSCSSSNVLLTNG